MANQSPNFNFNQGGFGGIPQRHGGALRLRERRELHVSGGVRVRGRMVGLRLPDSDLLPGKAITKFGGGLPCFAGSDLLSA